MKIAVLTCTYKRPRSLGYLIHCFERQTHQDRELLILDDAGQYPQRSGDRWQLVSFPRRFRSLGEKRNASAALASPDAEAFAIWDDDDLYLPYALEASAAALEHGDWSRPSIAMHPRPDWSALKKHLTGGLYHGGWGFRRELFDRAGWYPADSGPEDQGLMRKMEALHPRIIDPMALGFEPFYVYGGRQVSGRPNISCLGCNQAAYAAMGRMAPDGDASDFAIVAPPWLDLDRPRVDPQVYPRPF